MVVEVEFAELFEQKYRMVFDQYVRDMCTADPDREPTHGDFLRHLVEVEIRRVLGTLDGSDEAIAEAIAEAIERCGSVDAYIDEAEIRLASRKR